MERTPNSRTLFPALIVAATFIAYAAALSLGFVFDDHVLIVTNDSIRSWHYLPTYFTSHIWSFRYPHLLANYYRPLFLTWLRVNDMLFGLRPWGWHLTSVLAHVAVTLLVYRLALLLTRDMWMAGTAGLLFGLHPVHVEAVADITSIQEPLSTLFIVAALLAFSRSMNSANRWPWLAASLAFTAAALLSKESGMVLPILIGLYALSYGVDDPAATFDGKFSDLVRSAVRASLPFWAVVCAYVPLRVHALKGFAHIVTPVPLTQEIYTLPSVLLFYLRILIWPFGLSCYYDMPYVSSPGWRNFGLPVIVLIAVLAFLAIWWRNTRRTNPLHTRAIEFCTGLMLVTILPVLNLRFLPEGEIAHDRYVYLPSVGFVILVALAVGTAAAKVRLPGSTAPIARPAWVVAGLFVVSAMGYATLRQTLFWSDDLTLNFRAHQIAPHNVYATTSLAAAVAQRGMNGPAMALYQQALAVQPNFWRANVNLAYLYYAQGNDAEAAKYFERSCAADPTDGDQFLYLGMALLRLGKAAEAEKAVRSALLVRPGGRNYELGLGMVLKAEGKLPEAKQAIETELAEDPQNTQAQGLLTEVNSLVESTSKRQVKAETRNNLK